MMNRLNILIIPILHLACSSVSETETQENTPPEVRPDSIITVGAARLNEYLPLLAQQEIALVVNQTSMIGGTHLADSLQSLGISIKKIFAPEHGFRGTADAGEQVVDGLDTKTGIPVYSLYGNKKKPTEEDLSGLDWVVFDIQDVGARFYTYISSMTYIMESCAESGVNMLVLDRPNPLGYYVDGPVLEEGFQSFVGMHQVPIVHGMTIGEYAQMVNGEGWLSKGVQCDLTVITCDNYTHSSFYDLPINPSPNLPNMRSIYLYPSICLFEGTEASEGRGTQKQFQIVGSPNFIETDFQFVPKSMPGAKYPKHEGKVCFGLDYSQIPVKELRMKKEIDMQPILTFYNDFPEKENFFLKNNFFDKLAGSDQLRKQIKSGLSEKEIRESWQDELNAFKAIRKKYLLYEDFD